MIDKLNELDQRVTAIVDRFRSSRTKIEELLAANDELRRESAAAATLGDENRALRDKIRGLEQDVASFQEREGEIRGRLQTILERISALEVEIQESGRVPQ